MRAEDKQAYIAEKLRKYPDVKHIDYSICSQCKNACCTITGCGLMPCDVPDMSVQGIKAMLDTGKYSITFIEEEEGELEMVIPIMLSREVDDRRIKNSLIHKSCALLGKNGCILEEEERPTQALLFIPRKNRTCTALVKADESFLAWMPYQDILEEVVLSETGKSSKQLYEEGCVQDMEFISTKLKNEEELTEAEEAAASVLVKKMIRSNPNIVLAEILRICMTELL